MVYNCGAQRWTGADETVTFIKLNEETRGLHSLNHVAKEVWACLICACDTGVPESNDSIRWSDRGCSYVRRHLYSVQVLTVNTLL